MLTAKRWLTIWFTTISVIVAMMLISLLYFLSNGIPLRFSDSISYDAKLSFIREQRLLEDADTLVIGSSVALNNIDSTTLQKHASQIQKVANISAWGSKSSEVLQLLKLIDLSKVNYIIYSNQYFDFDEPLIRNIDEEAAKRYLYDEFTLHPYIKTFSSLLSNLDKYLHYQERFFDKEKFSYLGFTKSGDVNLAFHDKAIDKERWLRTEKDEYVLSTECLDDLIALNNISRSHDIKLIVVTAPFCNATLEADKDLTDIFDRYVDHMSTLSQSHGFTYLNMHETLGLGEEYFADSVHLKKKGAILYSTSIAKKISEVSDQEKKYLAVKREVVVVKEKGTSRSRFTIE